IMGPSGCGKSTLLNILGTIDRPSGGRYLFEGTDIARAPEGELAKLRRDRLGFIFQSFNLIDELTIAENVALGLAYRPMSSRDKKERVAAAMD
ncbi:ATP-binding cassette domain-containing protein, partial [Pseudomonas sp. GP01-A4]